MAIIDDHLPDDNELAVVVYQQQSSTGCCDGPDGQIDYPPPLSVVLPEGVETAQEKRFILVTPGSDTIPAAAGRRFKHRAQRTGPHKVQRKRSWPTTGAKSAKSDMDGNSVPTRKRRRQAGPKSAKSKIPAALKRATKVQEELPEEYPSFTKHMLVSHVVEHFWLGVPSDFCKSHLPEHDVLFTLEDEHGQSYNVKYLYKRKGLSGGWVTFARKHSLKVGDAAVFRLMGPTELKVYIIRGNEGTSDDDKSKEGPGLIRASSSAPDDDGTDIAYEEAVDDVDDMRYPDESDNGFYGMTSFSDFNIVVDGFVVDDHELFPGHLREAYYKLCCDRKVLLHRNLLKGINPALVVGLITQTVSISEGVKAISLASSCSREYLVDWKMILESLELMGMDVGFLRQSVDELLCLLTVRYRRWYTRRTKRPSSRRVVPR